MPREGQGSYLAGEPMGSWLYLFVFAVLNVHLSLALYCDETVYSARSGCNSTCFSLFVSGSAFALQETWRSYGREGPILI